MSEFLDVVNGNVQKSGEYWHGAVNVMQTFPELEVYQLTGRIPEDQEQFWVTPSVTPRSDSSETDKAVIRAFDGNTSYALAARKSGRQYSPSDELFLIVNGNFANPTLKLAKEVDTLFRTDGNITTVDDAHKFLPRILQQLQRSAERAAYEASSKARHNKSVIRGLIGATATVAILGGGAYKGIDIYRDRQASGRAEAEAVRDEFDARELDLDGAMVSAGDMEFVPSQIIVAEIPSPSSDDTYLHPRRITMPSTDDCKQITSINPETESVVAVTDGAPEKLFIAINSAGIVQVCYFGQHSASDEEPDVAIQVVAKDNL